MKTILFADGKVARLPVYVVEGACLVGDPTAYVFRCGQRVWVIPGESVEFVEATQQF